MVVYARHVYLDAQGLRAERVGQPRRRFALRLSFRRKRADGPGKSAVSDASTRKLSVTVTAPPQSNASNRAADSGRSQPPTVVSKANAANTQSESPRNRDEEPTTYKLSRAERRRQAKEKRRAA
jgi:hypothetical protein